MRLSFGLGLKQRIAPSHSHNLALKALLEQRLQHPEYPAAAKGFEGLRIAHGILQDDGAVGLLIGGLSDAVWGRRRTANELYTHKDVDVLVLDESFKREDFYKGIDWWIPRTERITLKDRYGSSGELNVTYYRNFSGVVLSFGAKTHSALSPGLYIPDSEWVVDMRGAEAVAHVEVELDYDVIESFRERVRERVRTRLPRFLRDSFRGYVLSPAYESDPGRTFAIELLPFDLRILRGIHAREQA